MVCGFAIERTALSYSNHHPIVDGATPHAKVHDVVTTLATLPFGCLVWCRRRQNGMTCRNSGAALNYLSGGGELESPDWTDEAEDLDDEQETEPGAQAPVSAPLMDAERKALASPVPSIEYGRWLLSKVIPPPPLDGGSPFQSSSTVGEFHDVDDAPGFVEGRTDNQWHDF
eukprot:3011294-Amphidinium_carterae.1